MHDMDEGAQDHLLEDADKKRLKKVEIETINHLSKVV
jgi:hypothetical protein